MAEVAPLLVGDFYAGAYGPTIVLIMTSPDAVVWLGDVFRDLACGGATRTFTAEPQVQIARLDALEMVRRHDGPRVTLRRRGASDRDLIWSATTDGWLHLADLVQPCCEGETGHQYLTEDEDDVALIELSYGEPDVLASVRRVLGEQPEGGA